jgi:hypothetical protein
MDRNKALYISLLLDPRIKEEGLESLGLNKSQIGDIIYFFKEEYNQ